MNDGLPKRRVYNEPGHAHELTFCCYRRLDFLKAERTCRWFAKAIENARVKHDFDLWAYVFMPNHAHLIIHPRATTYDISAILTSLKKPVADRAITFIAAHAPGWLPRINTRRGHRTERHFWQTGGGCDRNVIEPRTLLRMIDYVHLNPVRRGLVACARDWRWSSAAWYEGEPGNGLDPDPIPAEWTNEE